MSDQLSDDLPNAEPPQANTSQEAMTTDKTVAEIAYPVASSLFQVSLKPLEAIKDECYVFLDANVLLRPYQYDTKGQEEIRKAYAHLSCQNRLFVAGQAAREFANRRTKLLQERHEELCALKEQLWKRPNVKRNEPFNKAVLKWLGEKHGIEAKRQVANAAIEQLNAEFDKVEVAVKPLSEAVGKIISDLKSFRWNDPVSEMYTAIFTPEMVIEPVTDRETIQKDFNYRHQHKIPPGFADAGKGDETHPYGAIGDLLIWYAMLDKAIADNKHIIFVSADANKGDWWVVTGKTPLFPRFELVDEFYRATKGRTFHIVNFPDFLALYEASEVVVKEVRAEEAEQRLVADKDASIPPFVHLARIASQSLSPAKIQAAQELSETVTRLYNEVLSFVAGNFELVPNDEWRQLQQGFRNFSDAIMNYGWMFSHDVSLALFEIHDFYGEIVGGIHRGNSHRNPYNDHVTPEGVEIRNSYWTDFSKRFPELRRHLDEALRAEV